MSDITISIFYILVFVDSGAFGFLSAALLITKIDVGIMGKIAR